MLGTILIVLGVAVFLVGYWFLGYNRGNLVCDPAVDRDKNFGGGIAGIVIGIVIMIIGFVVNLSSSGPIEIPN